MNKQLKFPDDPLKEFIINEKIENAPEGFTSNVMTRIQMESIAVQNAEKSKKRNLVPFISVVITLILIFATFIIPAGNSDSFSLLVLEQIKNIKTTFPVIDLKPIFSFSLSNILIYVFSGIFILTFFDRFLYEIFHRREKS
jgi:hypothetical protein